MPVLRLIDPAKTRTQQQFNETFWGFIKQAFDAAGWEQTSDTGQVDFDDINSEIQNYALFKREDGYGFSEPLLIWVGWTSSHINTLAMGIGSGATDGAGNMLNVICPIGGSGTTSTGGQVAIEAFHTETSMHIVAAFSNPRAAGVEGLSAQSVLAFRTLTTASATVVEASPTGGTAPRERAQYFRTMPLWTGMGYTLPAEPLGLHQPVIDMLGLHQPISNVGIIPDVADLDDRYVANGNTYAPSMSGIKSYMYKTNTSQSSTFNTTNLFRI